MDMKKQAVYLFSEYQQNSLNHTKNEYNSFCKKSLKKTTTKYTPITNPKMFNLLNKTIINPAPVPNILASNPKTNMNTCSHTHSDMALPHGEYNQQSQHRQSQKSNLDSRLKNTPSEKQQPANSKLNKNKSNTTPKDDLPTWMQNRKLLERVFIIWLILVGYMLFSVFA